jgi:hypothetical protein
MTNPHRQLVQVRFLGLAMALIPTLLGIVSLGLLHGFNRAGEMILLVIATASVALAERYYAGYDRRRSA